MSRAFLLAPALALLLLAACVTENAKAPEASAAPTQAPANEGANLFSNAEMQMNERMMAAQGANAAEAWVRKMIEHHRGGVEMSELLLAQQGVSPAVAEKARTTAADQRRDIQHLEAMLQGGVVGSGQPNAYAQAEQQMHQQMMAVAGTDAGQIWLRKMIEHHRGAIAMSEIVIAQGGNAEVTAMARENSQKQAREIEDLQRLLQG